MNTMFCETVRQLREERECLIEKNAQLSYQLNELEKEIDIANEQAVKEKLRKCGDIIIDGTSINATYQDMVGILLSNGYCVELEPLNDDTRLHLIIKEREDEENE